MDEHCFRKGGRGGLREPENVTRTDTMERETVRKRTERGGMTLSGLDMIERGAVGKRG